MKPLLPAPAPVLSLTTALNASPLTAQTKAQKLRTHAQEKRTPKESGFHDQLRARQGNGGNRSAREADENASSPSEEVKGQAKEESIKPQSQTRAAEGVQGSSNAEPAAAETEAAPMTADAAAEEVGGDPNAKPYVEQIVAQVLQAVDPALRLKPTAVARAAGTVAGNTAAAMRTVDAGPAPASEANDVSIFTSDAGVAPVLSTEAREPATAHAAQAHRDEPQTPPAKPDNPTEKHEGSKPSVAQTSRPDRATETVSRADASMNPAATPARPRAEEARATLTPTLSAVGVEAQTRAAAKAAGAAAETAQRRTVADQVAHGLQVAMHDLPAPAGERLVTLKLHPSALGSLRISMHVSGDAVNVRFQVGSAKAKAAIGKAIDDLKDSIARQGLRVASMEIEEDSALAAPTHAHDAQNTGFSATGATDAAGKGFATSPSAPLGAAPPADPSADDGTGRMPIAPGVDDEGGVLQVLTFRLDAVG